MTRGGLLGGYWEATGREERSARQEQERREKISREGEEEALARAGREAAALREREEEMQEENLVGVPLESRESLELEEKGEESRRRRTR